MCNWLIRCCVLSVPHLLLHHHLESPDTTGVAPVDVEENRYVILNKFCFLILNIQGDYRTFCKRFLLVTVVT